MSDLTLKPMKRVPTGILGLDTILHGGLLQGGIYIIDGAPGVGKTVLGNQICFNHVAAGGRAVFIGLLSETHAQIFAHLQMMSFFTLAPIAHTLFYFSGYDALQRDGLPGFLEMLRRIIDAQRPTLLVIDGLMTAEILAASNLELKQFFSDLHAVFEAHGCTGLLLTHASRRADQTRTVVDGLIGLKARFIGPHAVREIQVQKFRGSSFLEGRHAYEITNEGVVVHPRTEAASIRLSPEPAARNRLGFGVAQLDEMLGGGILEASTTMLLGVPGSGKTLLGLHFLTDGARHGQPGLYFGFSEPPARLIDSAHQVRLDMGDHVTNERLHIAWQSPVDNLLDALAERLLEAAQQWKIQRLFIDGFSGFQTAIAEPKRLHQFFTALTYQLYTLHVTTLFSVEMNNLFGPIVEVPIGAASAIADNILLLRYVELRSKLYRLISILKMRSSYHATEIREFKISSAGLEVADTFESAEAILTGLAQLRGGSVPPTSGNHPSQGQP